MTESSLAAASQLSPKVRFAEAKWPLVPDTAGAYAIFDQDEVIYVGMAGRDGKGSLRRRLRDHASGQIVNMFAQYLFLARVQFRHSHRISKPSEAKAACREYLVERCSFAYIVAETGIAARRLEVELKAELGPALNP